MVTGLVLENKLCGIILNAYGQDKIMYILATERNVLINEIQDNEYLSEDVTYIYG